AGTRQGQSALPDRVPVGAGRYRHSRRPGIRLDRGRDRGGCPDGSDRGRSRLAPHGARPLVRLRARPPMIAPRLAAGLRTAWDRRWLSLPDLGTLRAKARKLERAKLEGDAPWRPALERLVDSLETEAQLNEIGVTFAYVQLSD